MGNLEKWGEMGKMGEMVGNRERGGGGTGK